MSVLKPKCRFVWLGVLLLGAGVSGVASPSLTAIKQQVHQAALTRDYATLRRLMVADFTWSFGGDGSVAQAIEAWKANPGELRTLARITAAGVRCMSHSPVQVACPAKAGLSHRAGFVKVSGQWRLASFVAGD